MKNEIHLEDRNRFKTERISVNLSIPDLSRITHIPIWEIKLHENGGRLMSQPSFEKACAVFKGKVGNENGNS